MDFNSLSKEISYALRHAPWEYELELDCEGWVDARQLVEALREEEQWCALDVNDLREMITRSDKKRHELADGRIRALYGHSKPQHIQRKPATPPEILYHGTARRFIPSIREQGLLPRGRQYVHLSVDTETALQVGKRRDDEPVLLIIKAREAWGKGLAFYEGNSMVWLADSVPREFLNL